MLSRHGIRSLCCAAVTTAILGMSGITSAAEEVKIGFLVKQAEEPWFQTEWQFAEKAGKELGFTVIKIAVPDGEKTLSAIDNLAANGVKGFVICPPDVSLGPAIVAKAKANGMKVMAVDDRFVDAGVNRWRMCHISAWRLSKLARNRAPPWRLKRRIANGMRATGRTPTRSSTPTANSIPARSALTVRWMR